MIIKRILYYTPILFLLALTSCKKDRTCECDVTEKLSTGNSQYKVTYTMRKVTKNTAKSSCFNYEARDVSTGETISYYCNLKK